MVNVLERSFYAGLGALMYFQEKADEIVSDMIDRGRMAPEEGRRLIDDMDKRLREEMGSFRDWADKNTQEFLRQAGMATKDDVRSIRDQLEEINKRLKSMEKRLATPKSQKASSVDLEP